MRVPTGFVLPDDEEVNPEGKSAEEFFSELRESYDTLPCTLYTGRSGVNYFVHELDVQKYVLAVGTD